MKNCLLVILLCTAWWLRGAEFSFRQVRPKRAESQNACMLHIEEDGVERFLGTLGVDSPHPVPVSLVKLSVDEKGLNVDTRELFEKHPSVRGVTLVFINFISPGEIVRNAPGRESAERINRLELTASTDSDGLEAAMFYSGQAAGEHWWRVERKALGRQSATYAFDQFLPDSLTVLHFRVDLQSPGVYHLQKAAFRTAAVEKRKYDSSVNQILNGGAERGLCDTSAVKRENIASVFDGKVRNWRGECIESDMHIDIDGENAYAGAHSFRMRRDTAAEVLGELRFNPVPAEEGAPVSFSFYARADRPVNAGVAFYVASACAIVKQIQVGTQWQKYELFVPSWGEKNEDFAILGEITGNPLAPGSVIPCIALYSEGTMWVDNAAAAIGGHAEFDASERVYLSHRLDHADSCYYAGEPAVASLTVNNVSETPLTGRISWQVLNSFGDELASGAGAELSLGAKSRQTLTQAVVLPEQLRGAGNLVFRFSSDGGQAESSAYFGVVDRCETPGRRLGVEVPSANNPKRMIPWLKKFRIGMIRVGCASGSLENAFRTTPFYAAAGIRILLNASMSDAAARDPEVYAGELRDMKGYLNEYGRYVEVIEAKNEPNLSPGWDVGMNLKTIRELYALRQELGLKFRLAGPATCGTDISWIDNLLALGAADYLDVISEHPYRERPELPDYGRESAAVRKLADRCKPSLEYYATESGRVHPSGPRARITAYERTAAARDVRNVILAHHSGQDRYYHFGAALDPFGNNWAVFYAGGLDNAAELRPNVGLFAMRAMVDLLDGAVGAGVVRFGADCRCLLFTAGNTTTAVLWKWNGAPVRLAFEAGDFKRFRVYDFMKCRVDSPELSVGETPLYFVSDLPPAEVAALLKRGHMEQGTGPVFRVESHLLGEHDFEVEIRNLSADERRDVVCTFSDDAAIDGASTAAVDSIPGESSARLRFRTRSPLSAAPQNFALTIRSGSLVQEASLPLGGIIVRRTPRRLKMDGRLDDWGLAVPVELTCANAVESIPWLPEYRKVKANLRWLWDDQYLYIAVEVFKKDFFEQQDLSDPAGLYAGDSFQVCFDPVSNGRIDQVGFSDDDFEYSLGMRRGRAAVYRRCASSSTYDSVSKPLGLIENEVELAFRREPDRYVYEAAFPRKSFSPFRLKAGASMRSSIIVNLNDGRQRIGYLELTKGIGEAKIPGLWMNTVLVEQ